MKNFTKYVLQNALGYQRYLRVFAKYKIRTLRKDKKEGDFFAFMEEVNKEGVLMDVGANLGVMTYHLSKKFPEREIIAIEPMPNNFSVLNYVISNYDLKNITVIPNAVGDKKEVLQMILPVNGKVKMQGLAHVMHDSIDEWNEGDTLEVMSERLDDIANGEPVAGIKMDIENFEFFALKGAEELIEKYHPVIYLELWPNANRDKCFELLRNHNYQVFVVVDNQLTPYDPASHTKQNFIFKEIVE